MSNPSPAQLQAVRTSLLNYHDLLTYQKRAQMCCDFKCRIGWDSLPTGLCRSTQRCLKMVSFGWLSWVPSGMGTDLPHPELSWFSSQLPAVLQPRPASLNANPPRPPTHFAALF